MGLSYSGLHPLFHLRLKYDFLVTINVISKRKFLSACITLKTHANVSNSEIKFSVQRTGTTSRGHQTLVLIERKPIKALISKIWCATYGQIFVC